MEEQAFPIVQHTYGGSLVVGCKGLTKREYAAIEAMKGLLNHGMCDYKTSDEISQWAIGQADSLIKILKEEK